MSILDRDSLEQSSLSDLHAIASELSIDSFRRLRKAELINVILERQSPTAESGDEVTAAEEPAVAVDERPVEREEVAVAVEGEPRDSDGESRPRRRRLRRGRRRDGEDREESAGADSQPAAGEPEREDEVEPEPADESPPPERREPEADAIDGVIEVLSGGSGFVRVDPPDPSDNDVYVSAAQVRRFELVSGDRVSGPRRPPRRSERFASLVRVEAVNGRSVSELSETVSFDEQPVSWPSQPLGLDEGDPTVAAVLSVVPLGRGSRIIISGPAQSGKTETIKRLAAGLAGVSDLDVQLVLSGVRPEEIAQSRQESPAPAGAQAIGTPADVRAQALEAVVEAARRLAGRGTHTVVLIDTLDGLSDAVKTKILASARSLDDGGSVTVIATASEPTGGETGVVGLSPLLAAAGRWPAVDPASSWVMRPELLVGEARADGIRRARAQALDR